MRSAQRATGNSLPTRIGNFLTRYRELSQAIREACDRIREHELWRAFCPIVRGAEPAALAPPRDLTRQPRSSKRLDHRIPASGRGIVPGCARLGMSERFIRFR